VCRRQPDQELEVELRVVVSLIRSDRVGEVRDCAVDLILLAAGGRRTEREDAEQRARLVSPLEAAASSASWAAARAVWASVALSSPGCAAAAMP